MSKITLTSAAAGALCVLLCAPPAALAGPAQCGRIVMNDKSLRNEGVYGVTLLEIDGKAPFRHKYDHSVAVGTHRLLLGEKIPQHDLAYSVQRHRDRSIRNRELTLEVKADERIVIAAKLDAEHKDDVNAYWMPLVLKDESKPCKPD